MRLTKSGGRIEDPEDLRLVAPYVRAMLRIPSARWSRFIPWLVAIVVIGEAVRVGIYISSGRWGWALYRLASGTFFLGFFLWWRRLRTKLAATAQVNGIDVDSRT